MKKEILYEIKALYRDDFRVSGYRFGSGEPSVCIVGGLRGNEFQQIYVCSQLIKKLSLLVWTTASKSSNLTGAIFRVAWSISYSK